jgi:hypothetical protein
MVGGSVGVRLLTSADDASGIPAYKGVSYCDAVRRAREGECLRIVAGSIQVCRWSPVVLGLKPAEGRFEKGLEPRLAYPTAGLLLAPLGRFPDEPQAVLVQAPARSLQVLLDAVEPDQLWAGHAGRLDRSALPIVKGQAKPPRHDLIRAVNRVLSGLAGSPHWQALTRWLFRSGAVTAGFDALISRTLADMSVCRNSTVVPLVTGLGNVSFFCTGGITWGRNRPEHLTAGWPLPVFEAIAPHGGEL